MEMEVANSSGYHTPTGWLLSLDETAHLMFVPPSAKLLEPSESLVLLANAALGDQWHRCFTPYRLPIDSEAVTDASGSTTHPGGKLNLPAAVSHDGKELVLPAMATAFFPAPGLELQQTPIVHRTACLTANNAFEHLKLRQIDIIKAMGRPEIPTIALAGFNEGLVQQDMATLLEEIHIVLLEDLAPPQHILDAVGKACSPFPSMIFMPSGRTFRPPVFNSEGKFLTFEDLIPPPSASHPRFSIARDKGQTSAVQGSTAGAGDHQQSPSDGIEDGQNQGEQSTNSTTESSGSQAQAMVLRRSNSDDELQPGEEGNRRDDGRSTVPRNTITREGENASIANSQGRETMPPPQGPPVPGDDGSVTQRPHNIRFDIAAAIYQPSPGTGLLQTLRLTGNFNFQVCTWLWLSFL
jgi:hypothetical protein